MTAKSVLVLCGGLSAEREVSIRSGRRIAAALADNGHQIQVADFDAQLLSRLKQDRPDVVVPLLHGAEGEDGSLPTMLELLGIAFVGSPARSCRLAFDKPVANEIVAAKGIRVPQAVTLPQRVFRELGAVEVVAAILERVSLPLIIKPTRGGSALGVTAAHQVSEVAPALVAAFAYGETVLVQHFVSGIEIAISVVADGDSATALPAVEICPDGDAYDYRARYTAGLTEFFAPARLPEDLTSHAANVAVQAHLALGLRDWSRTDLIVDEAGVVWYLETNSAPGMTETSLFPQAAVAAGQDLGQLCSALVRTAAERSLNQD